MSVIKDGYSVYNRPTKEDTTVYEWEIKILKTWSTNEICNHIWSNVSTGQPIPGCIKVQALRQELINRGEEPYGYHNT